MTKTKLTVPVAPATAEYLNHLADHYSLEPETLTRLVLEAFAEMASSTEETLQLPLMFEQVS